MTGGQRGGAGEVVERHKRRRGSRSGDGRQLYVESTACGGRGETPPRGRRGAGGVAGWAKLPADDSVGGWDGGRVDVFHQEAVGVGAATVDVCCEDPDSTLHE